MRTPLLATTCFAALASPATAQTVIDTARTTAVRTATVASGAAGDVRIAAAGSVRPASGAAITVDSPNSVTNEGTVQVSNADGATGIVAVAGGSGTITNAAAGRIVVDESYEPTDTDRDGDLDGPFASGANRAGIRTLGAFAGTITNAGSILVEGNDSGGIALGGRLTGGLTTSGDVRVIGDRAVGVRTGDITGPVRIAGGVSAQGRDAIGVLVGGDVGGSLVIQGAISSTGYRSTTAPADSSKLDADDLLQGGPAISIRGNVAGGVILAVPPRDASATDPDEDKDGIEDAREGSAAVTSFGAAPALQIGATDRDIALGAVGGTPYGLVIDGTVSGTGVYAGVSGNAVAIGGAGGAVSLSGGMAVNGIVQASGADATAIRIGARASVPELRVAGTVSASGTRATAILVDAGAAAATVRVTGAVRATASGSESAATALVDRAGTVTLIENGGTISATGAAANSGRNIAVDLRANAAGVTVRQLQAATGAAAPAITGDVLFGGGADVMEVADGTVAGAIRFGDGRNRLAISGDAVVSGALAFGSGADTVNLAGSSVFAGTADFGGGSDTLAIGGTARFSAALANAGALAVNVSGGTFESTAAAPVAIGSLAMGSGSTLGVTIDAATGASTRYDVAGTASFATGTKVVVRVNGLAAAEGRHVVVRAGTLTGGANLTTDNLSLPFLFTSGLTTAAANEVAIALRRKTATELDLNRSGAAAYDAIYKALGADAKVAGAVLDIRNGEDFRRTIQSMLPDHAGGLFDVVSTGSRAAARFLADGGAMMRNEGRWGYRVETVAWGRSKRTGNTAAYDLTGVGFSGSAELDVGLGRFGLSATYLNGQQSENGTDNSALADTYELGLYWRAPTGPLRPYVRGAVGHVDLSSRRNFSGTISGSTQERVTRLSAAAWDGFLLSAGAGLSYQADLGPVTLRPRAAVDYVRLREDARTETGGGRSFDLRIDERVSDEFAGEGSLSLGWMISQSQDGWIHTELEGGWREVLNGGLGATTARFEGGEAFTLLPEARTSGWLARLRAIGGNRFYRVAGEMGGEEQQGRTALSVRAMLQVAL